MPNFDAALAQLEKSKDNSVLPNWEVLSQLQNLKDNQKAMPGILPNFDILLQQQQQQLSQNSKEGGNKGGMLNWEALAQLQLPNQNSKDSLKNLTPGIPNLDLLLQLQLTKDSNSMKNFSGWEALALNQMQLSQGQLGKDNQSKHQSSAPNFDSISQLQQSFKEGKSNVSHNLQNFETLALTQLHLAQGLKDSQNKSLSNIPTCFETQMGQNLKDAYSKNLGLSGVPNFEALMQLQMGKNSQKDSQGKGFELLAAQMQNSKETTTKGSIPNFEALAKDCSSKSSMPGFEAFAQMQFNQGLLKDGKNLIPNLNFEGVNQFQLPINPKDMSKSAIPPFPHFEGLTLAPFQQQSLSGSSKDKNPFIGMPNFEALAKFQLAQNSKEALKSFNSISSYDDMGSKNNDWESSSGDGGSKDKK